MNDTTKNLQAMDDETRAYQELSSHIKFKQNLVQGIGVATVFGIIGAAGQKLFSMALGNSAATAATAATTTAATAAPVAMTAAIGMGTIFAWVAIAAVVALGIGCLYMSSKYYAESTRLDQNHQAKQIAKGMNDVAPTIAKPISYPAQNIAPAELAKQADTTTILQAANSNKPQNTVSSVQLQDKVVPIDALTKARA